MSWDQQIKARAIYDFASQPGSGEMSLVTGDVLTVTRQDVGDGWWEGVNNRGETGLFPEGYVEIIPSKGSFSAPPPPPPQILPPQPPALNQPAPQPQGSFENDGDWGEDDWDDDDSQASTNADGSYQQHSMGGHGFSASTTGSHAIGASGNNKATTVKRSYNRFSTFVKSGGEDYILGTKNKSAPSECHVFITEMSPGKVEWSANAHPYTCALASPKKESKLKGLKSYIAYSVTPSFNNIQVSRRFKHFDWLQGRLEEKFITIPIPPLPDKQVSGRYQEEFIRHRLVQLQLWVDRVCRHPVLSQSDVWMHFMTCTDEKRWKQGKRRAEKDDFTGASFFFTVQPPENPLDLTMTERQTEQFARFTAKMDDSVKILYATAQDQSKKYMGAYRREFGKVSQSFQQLADSFMTSGVAGDGPLTEAMKHTANTYDQIGKLYEEQPKNDLEPLSNALYEYKGLLANWPDILQLNRGATNKKKEHMKLEGNAVSSSVAQRSDVVSYCVLAEMDYFQEERIKDFKQMMQQFVTGQIDFYEKIVAELRGTLTKYDY